MTIENDKKIAKFMGRKVMTDGITWFDENYTVIKYRDFNSLIPVVEKIESLKVASVIIDGRLGCEIKSYETDFKISILSFGYSSRHDRKIYVFISC